MEKNEFTFEELVEDGMTPEEAQNFLNALAFGETIDQLPEDISAFIKKYDEMVPNDLKGAIETLLGTTKKDEKFFQNFMALSIVLNHDSEENKQEKETVFTKLPPEVRKTVEDNYFKKLASLSDEERKEFIEMISNITEEQKLDIIERLK